MRSAKCLADFKKPEKAAEVFRGLLAHRFRRETAQFADLAGGFKHERRFVSLATMRNGRKIWRVGFNQHAVKGYHLCRIADILRFGERDVAGEGNQEAKVKSSAGMLDAAGEAMQDAAQAACSPGFRRSIFRSPMLRDHCQAVIPGVFAVVGRAAVNDDWQLRRFG